MNRVLSDIFDRFDPERLMHRLTSDAIGQVLQRRTPCNVLSWDNHRRQEEIPPPEVTIFQRTTLGAPEVFSLRTIVTPEVRPTRSAGTEPVGSKPKRKRAYVKSERRRLQCLASQKRYIKRQNDHIKNLEITVAKLRQEVPALEVHRSRLLSTENWSVCNVAIEFFQLFSYGIRSYADPESHSGTHTWLQHQEERQQLAFLRAAMADNITVGTHQGVHIIAEQLRRYTAFFDDNYLHLDNMTQVSTHVVIAYGTLNATVSEATLQHVLLGLLNTRETYIDEKQGEEDKTSAIRSKLLGQRLLLPCTFCFEWDSTSSCVVRLEPTVDFLSPLIQLLGALEDASFVLDKAAITPNSAIGEVAM